MRWASPPGRTEARLAWIPRLELRADAMLGRPWPSWLTGSPAQGAFLGRPATRKRLGFDVVSHGAATFMLYGVVMLAWFAAGLYAAVRL
jgi:hypothetical protein